MLGIVMIIVLAIMGGIIAYLGDKLGSKIGKKRLSLFGLRPHNTSVLMTIISGVMVATITMGVLTASSKEVRTALFGMKKLQAELRSLTASRDRAQQELSAQSATIQQLDSQIAKAKEDLERARQEKSAAEAQMAKAQQNLASMQAQYEEASRRLKDAQEQAAQAEAARDQLQKDVKGLEEQSRKLRENIVTIREGNVVFRSGEILFSGTLRAGQNADTTKQELEQFLNAANYSIGARLNVKPDTPVIWLSKEAVESTQRALMAQKGNMYVRLCAAGNILSGEMVVSRLEMVPDTTVYHQGDPILRQRITVKPRSEEVDLALMAFLKDVNRMAQGDGVIPDPLTGKVGAINSADLVNASERISELGGHVTITARASRDVTVAGPVVMDILVQPIEEGQP
jgi:uncharacterized protein (DUF3084 family)